MFKKLDILDESDKHLRTKSVDATVPLSKDEKKLIQRIIDHLTYSQIEEFEKKYDLRPGMGLAFPQIGINKRIIVIVMSLLILELFLILKRLLQLRLVKDVYLLIVRLRDMFLDMLVLLLKGMTKMVI